MLFNLAKITRRYDIILILMELIPFDMYDIWWFIVLGYNAVFLIIIFSIPIQIILILTHQDKHQGLPNLVKTFGLAVLFYLIGIWYGIPILNKSLISHFSTGPTSDLLI